jgi:SAM-dependent methyltransferase
LNDRRAEIESRFGGSAEEYAVSASHRSGADLERMVELASLRGDERVLDVATGAGHTALRFASALPRGNVVAYDLAEGMIAVARRLAAEASLSNVSFALGSAERLDAFDDASFDVVTCRIAPHHFDDVGAFVREVSRVLVPGGAFVLEDTISPDSPEVSAFFHEVESRRDPTHVRSLTRSEWETACAEAGLTVEVVEVMRKPHPFEDWVRRGGSPESEVAAVREAFLNAPPAAAAHLDVVVEDGAVVSFTDDKILLRARRR